jgi:hypothetical protein
VILNSWREVKLKKLREKRGRCINHKALLLSPLAKAKAAERGADSQVYNMHSIAKGAAREERDI